MNTVPGQAIMEAVPERVVGLTVEANYAGDGGKKDKEV